MYFTGFADEVSGDFGLQIKATKELGWQNIEARNVDGKNITDISDEKFEEVYQKLKSEGISINCFGSAVANWGKNPYSDKAFKESIEELKRAIPRMKRLGTKMIRGMSFGIPENFDNPVNELIKPEELDKKILEQVKVLVEMCEEAEIYYVHENCMNYFSQSYEHMDKLLSEMDSPYFKIVFDTGNPVFSDNRIGEPPYQKQTTWGAYQHLNDKIHYIHIKDGFFIRETDGIFPENEFTFPGEGDGQVRKVLKDLITNGYDGGISIEPHMGSVYHESDEDGKSPEELKYNVYVEYGKRIMKMVEEIKEEL